MPGVPFDCAGCACVMVGADRLATNKPVSQSLEAKLVNKNMFNFLLRHSAADKPGRVGGRRPALPRCVSGDSASNQPVWQWHRPANPVVGAHTVPRCRALRTPYYRV